MLLQLLLFCCLLLLLQLLGGQLLRGCLELLLLLLLLLLCSKLLLQGHLLQRQGRGHRQLVCCRCPGATGKAQLELLVAIKDGEEAPSQRRSRRHCV